jgi:hypothetical protein
VTVLATVTDPLPKRIAENIPKCRFEKRGRCVGAQAPHFPTSTGVASV